MATLVKFNLTCLSVETFQSVFDRSISRSISGIRDDIQSLSGVIDDIQSLSGVIDDIQMLFKVQNKPNLHMFFIECLNGFLKTCNVHHTTLQNQLLISYLCSFGGKCGFFWLCMCFSPYVVGHDRMAVGFTTTYTNRANHH